MPYRTSQDKAWLAFRRIYWTLAGAMAIVLALLAVLGFGPGGRNCNPVAATASADGAPPVASDPLPAERLACRTGGPGSRPAA
jgi:hypothetical protein